VEAGDQPLLGDQHGRGGAAERVLQDVGQPLRWIARVERHVGATRLEDAQQAHDQVDRALDAEPHRRLRADPQGAQPAGEPVGPLVEPAVGQLLHLVDHGDRAGAERRLFLEDPVQGGLGGELAIGLVPAGQELTPLFRGQHRQLGQPEVRRRRRAGEQDLPVAQEAVDRHLVEEVDVVFERRAQPLGLVEEEDREVVLGRPVVVLQQGQLHPRQLQGLGGGVLEGELDLEDRRARQVALRLQVFHQLLEGDLLVGGRAEEAVAHPPQQLAEGGIARGVGALHHHVEEEADQPLGLQPVAVGDRDAEQQVVLAGVAVQQGVEAGEQGEEEGDPLPLAPGPDLLGLRARHGAGEAGAAGGEQGRARPVGRHLQRGEPAGQAAAPVGQVLLHGRAVEPAALPVRVVGVLER
jgi:hypothetical protein